MCYTEIHLMQCYVHLLHQGLVMGGHGNLYFEAHTTKGKGHCLCFSRQHVASSFTCCPEDIVQDGALAPNTILLFTNSKVLDLIFDQS